MNVVVLAGGLGTRLRQVVQDVPKPMADISGTPFLALILENLIAYGADEFILCVSHLRHVIRGYFGDSFHGVPVRYSVEEEPLGTGGAVKQAVELFGLSDILVVNGDTFVQADYARFWKECAGEPLSVLLKAVDNADRYGRVEVQDDRIISFKEKSANGLAGLINAGVYRMESGLFQEMPRRFSLEKDFLEPHVNELRPYVFLAGDYFIDIGIPESYAQACRELQQLVQRDSSTVQVVSSLWDCDRLLPPAQEGKCPALFLDRDGVINVDKNYVHRIEDCEFVDGIFDLCRAAKAKGYMLIIVTNQAGIAKGYYTEQDYVTLMNYMGAEFEKQGCPLDDVFYCPFHKDGLGEYRKDSEDRKPNPGMILKATVKHHIDLKTSVLIGDKDSDIEAGRRAGVGINIFYRER